MDPESLWNKVACSSLCLLQTWVKFYHTQAQTRMKRGTMRRSVWAKAWWPQCLDQVWLAVEHLAMVKETGESGGGQTDDSPIPQITTILLALDLTSSFSEGKACESHINHHADSTGANLPPLQVSHRDAANFCFENRCVPVCSEERITSLIPTYTWNKSKGRYQQDAIERRLSMW